MGSEISIIDLNVAKLLNITFLPTRTTLKPFSKQSTAVIGETGPIPITVGNQTNEINFSIVDCEAIIPGMQVLLGLDWSDISGAAILSKENKIILSAETVVGHRYKHPHQPENNEDDLDEQFALFNMNMEQSENFFPSCMQLENAKLELPSLLNDDDLNKLVSLLKIHQGSFASSLDALKSCKDFVFDIQTTDEIPIYSTAFRLPIATQELMTKHVNEYLTTGMLEPGMVGTWTAPAFVIIQNNKPRLISSLTKLNAKTV